MAGSIKKYVGRGGKVSWQVRLRKGKKLLTGTFLKREMAEDFITTHEAEIVQEKYFPTSTQQQKASDHTVAELLDIYETRIVNHMIPSTKVAYLHCLKYWRRVLGDTLLKN